MRISYSYGMVDLLHYGHIKALQAAKKDADLTYFGLVSDKACDVWYGDHVSNEKERYSVLEGIRFIDIVIPQKTFDPIDNLKKIHKEYPQAEITLFRSSEWKISPATSYLKSIGGKVVSVDYYEKMSLSNILAILNKKSEHLSNNVNNLISTKANTLRALQGMLKYSRIEKLAIFTVGSYQNGFDYVYKFISDNYYGEKIVIRSSSKREDVFEYSNAGHFASVLNIDSFDRKQVKSAFEKVIQSYYDGNIIPDEDEQILVQKQTRDVVCSGVIFTRDIQRNRPYYVINYDDSGSTDSVTAGIGGKIAWLWHDTSEEVVPIKWKNLIRSVRELEQILVDMLLDIEFAITEQNEIVVFQIRPLAAGYKIKKNYDNASLREVCQSAISSYKNYYADGLQLFSDMAFWNPAEIIGDNPRNLDYSLYRDIITHRVWSEGLNQMGYCLVSDDLMFKFGNKPYISINRSFEGLTPSSLDKELKRKLLKFYEKKFCEDFSCHDKIEFEIIYTCYDFALQDRISILQEYGFTQDEVTVIFESLRKLTIRNIMCYKEILDNDLRNLEKLEAIRRSIEKQNINDHVSISSAIRELLSAIRKYGTPQFSRQARCAFIAKSLCLSLVTKGYISQKEYDSFLASVTTVATDFEEEFNAFQKGEMNRNVFMEKYGHLRAGTYNIQSPRYDQMQIFLQPNQIDNVSQKLGKHKLQKSYKLSVDAISKAISEGKMVGINPEKLLYFMKTAIEQREYFKFVFTKSLSYVIELIRKLGRIADICDSDMSFLDIKEVESAILYDSFLDIKTTWKILISRKKEDYKIKSEIILPSIITDISDFYYIENIDARPNFITEKSISGDIAILKNENDDITGKIVVLEKADPGYDWIFTKGIVGLITKYGGAASHMAIRCAEFGIPAAIGCGEKIFNYILSKNAICLDCMNEKINDVQ